MPVEERGLTSGKYGKDARHDHWPKPNRVTRSSEIPDHATCKSEGRTRPTLSRPDRQGVANGLSHGSLGQGSPERRLCRGGWGNFRPHRSVWRGAMARGIVAGSEGWNLHTESGATGSDPEETARPVPAIGHSLHTGQGGADIGHARA